MIPETRFQQFKSIPPTHLKPIIAVTMATSRQGQGVVQHLSKTGEFQIRAITRNPFSRTALEMSVLPNVKIIQGDLLDKKSLLEAFHGAYGIFGNTTPTKGWILGRGSMVSNYELAQGRNLIDAIKEIESNGFLKHFIFSSICKPKDPLKNNPAPEHFATKWAIEEYIGLKELQGITTIIRPVSYFENFNTNLPGIQISKNIFPGILNAKTPWQTIAVKDIGLWALAAIKNPERLLGKSLNIAGEEMTGEQMASLLDNILGLKNKTVNYFMIPRPLINFLEHDIAIMADWIERTGYGVEMAKLKILSTELGIRMTSLEQWLEGNISLITPQVNKTIPNSQKALKPIIAS